MQFYFKAVEGGNPAVRARIPYLAMKVDAPTWKTVVKDQLARYYRSNDEADAIDAAEAIEPAADGQPIGPKPAAGKFKKRPGKPPAAPVAEDESPAGKPVPVRPPSPKKRPFI